MITVPVELFSLCTFVIGTVLCTKIGRFWGSMPQTPPRSQHFRFILRLGSGLGVRLMCIFMVAPHALAYVHPRTATMILLIWLLALAFGTHVGSNTR